MHEIGNYHDALTIRTWVRESGDDYLPRCSLTREAPEGWTFMGRGSYRSVWRSPEGVAYKVSHNTRYHDQQGDEAKALKRAWEEIEPLEGCRVPKFNQFDVNDELILAVEAIDGTTLDEYKGDDRDVYYEMLHALEQHYRVGDLHNENVMIDSGGQLVIVDLGG